VIFIVSLFQLKAFMKFKIDYIFEGSSRGMVFECYY